MIMYGDKKKVVSAILGEDGKAVAKATDDDTANEHHMISEELIDAIHKKDASAASDALRASHDYLANEKHEIEEKAD